MNYKTCTQCKQVFEATTENFHKMKSGKFGLASKCKKCKAEVNRLSDLKHKEKRQEARNKNKENKKLYDKQYVSENEERIKERAKNYYYENIDLIRARTKEYNSRPEVKLHRKKYRATRKERDKELYNAWREKNRDRIRQIKRRRYQSERSVISNLTIDEWNYCLAHFNNECAYCGEQHNELTQDHFIPVTKGGNYVVENIVPACRSCNSSKNNTDFEEWYSWQPFYCEERESRVLQYLGYDILEAVYYV